MIRDLFYYLKVAAAGLRDGQWESGNVGRHNKPNVRTRSACVHPAPGSAISPDLIAAACVSNHSVSSVCLLVLAGFNQSLFFIFCTLLFVAALCYLHHYDINTRKGQKVPFFSGNPLKCGRSSRGLTNKAIKGILEFTSTDSFF